MDGRMLIGASVLAIALGAAGDAWAKGKPSPAPPDLSTICTTFPQGPSDPVQDDIGDAQDMACDLLYRTDGERLSDCDGGAVDNTGDNGFVDYLGRNCDRNEEGLLSKMAGVAIKLEDILSVVPGKVDKTARKVAGAITVPCAYEAKVSDLATEPKLKLIEGQEEVLGSGGDDDGICDIGETCQPVDLAADAQDIRYLLPGDTDC